MIARCTVLLVIASCLIGCANRAATVGPPAAASFTIPVDDYAQAFATARGELKRRRFEVERVDASAGIILSQPKTGAGLLAPWTLAPGARIGEDTLNAQSRIVEVRFEAAESIVRAPIGVRAALAEPPAETSPANAAETVVVSVRVLITRRVSPTRRLDSSAIRYSLDAFDPSLFQRGLATSFEAPMDLDERAASQLARSIQRRLSERTTAPSGRAHTDGGTAHQRGAAADAQLAMQ